MISCFILQKPTLRSLITILHSFKIKMMKELVSDTEYITTQQEKEQELENLLISNYTAQ